VPLAGVLPLRRDHGLPEEDGLFDERTTQGPGAAVRLRVAVLAPPHISNLDEFLPLARVPGLRLQWVREPAALDEVDWIVLPGSKQVSGDLAWLRSQGLDAAITRHAASGGQVLGVCGGMQMLGRSLHDPEGHDGAAFADLPGLGLLPLRTVFADTKRLRAAPVGFDSPMGAWSPLAGLSLPAYEIRCGQTLADGGQAVLHDDAGAPIGWQHRNVLGLCAHGLFESPAVLRSLFGASVPTLETAFDTLADMVEEHLDAALLRRWLGA
jgi:adenosylcobyric acid synthase